MKAVGPVFEIEVSNLVWFFAFAVAAGWGLLGYFIGRRQTQLQPIPHAGELESLRDQNWSLKDEGVARRKAEAASEAKSRFLATMAHEIRTPLNGIMGLADLLKGTKISREQKSYIDAIRHSGEALNALVHEILDFSRIEAGHLDLHPELMSLTSLTEGVAELLAPKAQEKGLEIATFVSSKLPSSVIIDAARVRQVLLNLTGNAVKFTSSGGVGVSAELVDDTHIRFSVRDTGPGIATDQRSRIFNEFDTGDQNLTRAEAGAGLGLAISQRLVTHMGGTLNLAESSGPGATFEFVIPFVTDAQDTAVPVAHLARRRILIVAQTVFGAPFLERRLREAGNDVVLARDYASSVKYLVKGTIDAVAIDCAIGEAEAAQISAAAHSVGVARSLIMFSPYERGDFSAKVGTQFDGWLVKPVRTQSLLAQLWPENVAVQLPANSKLAAPASPVREKMLSFHTLLAEDDDINALVGKKILESLGAKVTLVRDGAAALEALGNGKAEKFDLCVIDIRMPKVSGLMLAQTIRTLEREQGARRRLLVAASANSLEADKAQALAAGFDFYLQKPLNAADLEAVILANLSPGQRAA